MSELVRRSPLQAHWANGSFATWVGKGLRLREIPFAGTLLLRGRPDREVASRIEAVLGQSLPQRTIMMEGAEPRLLLLAPSRWMVFAEPARAATVVRKLGEAVAGSDLAVSDLSDGQVRIEVEGRRGAELLAAGTAVDLNHQVFLAGHAAQTQLARIPALIARFGDLGFSLFVDASHAEHAWRWLTANARLVVACAPE